MTNDEALMPKEKRQFDLEERTATFGEAAINFAKKVPVNLSVTALGRAKN